MFHENILSLVLSFCFLTTNGAIIPITDSKGKLSLVEWSNYNYREPEGSGTYAFGYDIEDPETNNIQFRNEEKLANGSVVGSYGYLDPNGDVFMVNYIADERGYRASFGNPFKLSFLRPPNEIEETNSINNYQNEKPSNFLSNRIVTPNEDKESSTSSRPPTQPFNSQKGSNAFYYPQNILQNTEYHQSPDRPKGEGNLPSRPIGSSSNFNSIEESNQFYYPQNILNSPDFNKPGNSDHKITFQRRFSYNIREP